MHSIHPLPTSGIGRFSRPLLAWTGQLGGRRTALPGRALVGPLGRITMVGALALLLAGSVVTSTEAKTRNGAINANGLIGMCHDAGYDPFIFEFIWGTVAVGCPDLTDQVITYATGGASERAMAAEDSGNGAADAADHGRQKAKKLQKHKAHAKKHGKHGKR